MQVKGDPKAVDAFRHWGVIDDDDITSVKWLDKFAILVCGKKSGAIAIYKWLSDTPNKVRNM